MSVLAAENLRAPGNNRAAQILSREILNREIDRIAQPYQRKQRRNQVGPGSILCSRNGIGHYVFRRDSPGSSKTLYKRTIESSFRRRAGSGRDSITSGSSINGTPSFCSGQKSQ